VRLYIPPSPFRKIQGRFIISQHGCGITHGTATGLVLECGHRKQLPTSKTPKYRTRCVECRRRGKW
jgi:hypothetical protein